MALLRPAVCNKIFAFATNDIVKVAKLCTVTTAWQDTIDNYSHDLWKNIKRETIGSPPYDNIENFSRNFLILFALCYRDKCIDLLHKFVTYCINIDEIFRIKKIGWTAIAVASFSGNIKIVKLLLDAGYDKNSRISSELITPINIVSNFEWNRLDDLNMLDRNPLFFACANGNDEIVDLLVEAGCDPNEEIGEITPFYVAAKNDHVKCCQKLITKINIDACVARGLTAISYCCVNGNTEIAKIVIDAGCDLETQASEHHNGNKPLHNACYMGHLEIVKMLLEAGAKIDSTNTNEQTPLEILQEKIDAYYAFTVPQNYYNIEKLLRSVQKLK